MALKKSGLGRNLNALLGGASTAVLNPPPSVEHNDLNRIGIEHLQPGRYQPRRHFSQESLQELADSIMAQGIIQPIVVRTIINGDYEIIAGERRWRAAQLAGLTEVPIVVNELSDEATLAVALIENIQREDLNAIEEARALNQLVEEFSWTHQQVAEAVGKSRAAVSNTLRLLNLHPYAQKLLEEGEIEMGHARCLLALSSEQQRRYANIIVDEGLSVRAIEKMVREKPEVTTFSPKKVKEAVDPDVQRLQDSLAEKLATKVEIQYKPNGKGKLVVHFHSFDALDGVLERIR